MIRPATAPVAVADASVWVSRLVPADVNHQSSLRWLEEHFARGDRVAEPALLRAEIAGAIARATGDTAHAERIIARVAAITDVEWVIPDEPLWVRTAQLAARLRLRGADALYVAVAEQLRVPLVTWDQEQLTRASGLIVTTTP